MSTTEKRTELLLNESENNLVISSMALEGLVEINVSRLSGLNDTDSAAEFDAGPPYAEYESCRKIEKINYIERSNIITDIVRYYQDKPEVVRKVNAYRLPVDRVVDLHNDVQRYLRDIGQFRLLTYEQTDELFGFIDEGVDEYAKNGSKSLNEDVRRSFVELTAAYQILMSSNLPLVVSIAKHYKNKVQMDFTELIQEGNIGLDYAVKRFDASKGHRFSTYNNTWIHQSIRRAISGGDRLIRIPDHVHDQWLKLETEIAELSIRLQREPTQQEIAEYCGMSIKNLNQLRNVGRKAIGSIDVPFRSKDGNMLEFTNILSNETTSGVEGELNQMMDNDELSRMVMSCEYLTELERFIFSARSGLYIQEMKGREIDTKLGIIEYEDLYQRANLAENKSLEKFGKLLGVSKQSISITLSRATAKILRLADERSRNINY